MFYLFVRFSFNLLLLSIEVEKNRLKHNYHHENVNNISQFFRLIRFCPVSFLFFVLVCSFYLISLNFSYKIILNVFLLLLLYRKRKLWFLVYMVLFCCQSFIVLLVFFFLLWGFGFEWYRFWSRSTNWPNYHQYFFVKFFNSKITDFTVHQRCVRVFFVLFHTHFLAYNKLARRCFIIYLFFWILLAKKHIQNDFIKYILCI